MTKFQDALSDAVARGRIAGGIGLALDRYGITAQGIAGVREIGSPAALTDDTIFWIASMTKAVTSVAALQQVERGALTLDGDLAPVLPELRDLHVLEGVDADGKAVLRPARGFVTLRQLLSHTSGFGYGFTSPKLAAHEAATGLNPSSGVRAALRQPLAFDPGTGWLYGIGIDLAGLAVEAATGKRLDAYFRNNIFAPLGMVDTGFALNAEQAARKASIHVRGEGDLLTPFPFGLPSDPEALSGGGGLYSTAHDYARFLRMLINGGELDGKRVLMEATVRSLSEPQSGPHRAGAWVSAIPQFSNDFDLYPGLHVGHGLATLLAPQKTAEGRSAGSLTWGGLANTYYWADPVAGKAGVLLTQLLPFGDADVMGLMQTLEREAYGQ